MEDCVPSICGGEQCLLSDVGCRRNNSGAGSSVEIPSSPPERQLCLFQRPRANRRQVSAPEPAAAAPARTPVPALHRQT